MNNTLICITHIIANQSGFGHSPWSEASGQKVQYASQTKLKANYSRPYMVGDKQTGQTIYWQVDHTALNAPPCKEVESLLIYDYGMDKEYDVVTLASDIGVVEKKGAWFAFPNGEKFQGIDKAKNYLAENPEIYEEIYEQIKGTLL